MPAPACTRPGAAPFSDATHGSIVTDKTRIRRALISVSDKTGLADFARLLRDEFDVHILSTGGTARTLRDADIDVTDVAAHTGAPEIMAVRVTSLDPTLHCGILARRANAAPDMAETG